MIPYGVREGDALFLVKGVKESLLSVTQEALGKLICLSGL